VLEDDFKLTGVTKSGVTLGLVDVESAAKKLKDYQIKSKGTSGLQVEFKEGLNARADQEKGIKQKEFKIIQSCPASHWCINPKLAALP